MNSKLREILERTHHRVGSHSDDWGGDSDKPCYCEAEKAILALFESYASEREREAVLNWWRGRIIPHANDGTVKLEHFTAELATLKADTQEQPNVKEK